MILVTPSYASLFRNLSNMEDNLQIYENGYSYSVVNSGTKNNPGLFMQLILYFIMGVMTIAYTHLFIVLSHTTEKLSFSVFLNGFSLWLQGFLGFLWMMLWIILWSFLFFIPGIVKAISYSQMFFILAEHPQIGVRKAMRISKVMTQGYKGDLFVMFLSFIGWYILSAFTAGLLYLWLVPYQQMSFTNAYHALKTRALETGNLKEYDFQ